MVDVRWNVPSKLLEKNKNFFKVKKKFEINLVEISTSILSANLENVGSEITKLKNSDYIHVDIMDGHFVPNLTFGTKFLRDIKNSNPSLKLDVHLMVENPENYVEEIADIGVEFLTVHYEACKHLDRVVTNIIDTNTKVGLALIPTTSESVLEYIIDKLDLVLVMTVNPGFGGQKFLESQLPKIKKIKNLIQRTNKTIKLEVDGGINQDTIKKVVANGIDIAVTGSYIFGVDDYEKRINILKKERL